MGDLVKKTRPYWHVDAKWICALLLIPILTFTMIAYALFVITGKEKAIEISTLFVASSFSPNGLDDKGDFDKIKADLLKSNKTVFKPIPNLNIEIPKTELEIKSPRELRLAIFRPIVEPMYGNDIAKLRQLSSDPTAEKGLTENRGLLDIFTLKTHKIVQNILLILVGVSVLLLFLVIIFSSGLGRLASPAIVFLIIGGPGLIVSFLLTKLSQAQSINVPLLEGSNMGSRILSMFHEALPPIVRIAEKNYLIMVCVGGGLLILALIDKIAMAVAGRIKNR